MSFLFLPNYHCDDSDKAVDILMPVTSTSEAVAVRCKDIKYNGLGVDCGIHHLTSMMIINLKELCLGVLILTISNKTIKTNRQIHLSYY